MFGAQPEIDVGSNETIYAALRYDEAERRPIRDIIRKTYFDGIDLIPGNLEVMEYEHETPRILANKSSSGAIFFERLTLALSEVESDYDVVILDTPPSLGFLTLSAIYAATSMIITVHPAMLDVASMSQFLLMMGDLISVLNESGAQLDQDFIRYLVTRHNPNDAPQSQVVAMLRHLFGPDVLLPTAIESTAVEAAGLAKRSIYELEMGQIGRDTQKRAREAIDAVNEAIVRLINDSWGRTSANHLASPLSLASDCFPQSWRTARQLTSSLSPRLSLPAIASGLVSLAQPTGQSTTSDQSVIG